MGEPVTRATWLIVELLAKSLEPAEREAVMGDVAERGKPFNAFRDVFGLLVRRQAALWMTWRPWAVTALLVLPLSFLLAFYSMNVAGSSAVTLWLYLNNWDWNLVALAAFRHDFPRFLLGVLSGYLAVACWSWASGFLLGAAARRAVASLAALFCVVVAFVEVVGPQVIFKVRAQDYHPNGPVFALLFYRIILPVVVYILLVFLPAVFGVRQGLRLSHLPTPSRVTLWIVALGSYGLMALQIQFILRAILHLVLPDLAFPLVSLPSWIQLLLYWPVLYWVVRTVYDRQLKGTLA